MQAVGQGTAAGSPTTGIVLFVLGFGVMTVAVLGWLPLAIPLWPVIAVGGFMAVLGVAIAIKELLRPPPAPGPKPATQTFLEQQRHALPVPRQLEPTPAPPEAPPEAPPTGPLVEIETQIQDLSREIGRAKVMYGTGKLSGEGYRSYVSDLEKKRGDLEAQRARLLMGKPE